EHPWDDWGSVPGGALLSLHPLDQARLLAHGFYRLLERLVRAEIPLVFLHFPRSVTDPDYLFEKLRSFLPPAISIADARTAHARVADSDKVRVDREFAEQIRPALHLETGDETSDLLSHAAASRELRRLQEEIRALAISSAASAAELTRQ